MPDAGLGAAGRRPRPSVRRCDGERLSRTERPGDPIPVEGEPQADPDRAPTRTRVPQGEPPGRGGTAVRRRCQVAVEAEERNYPTELLRSKLSEQSSFFHKTGDLRQFCPSGSLQFCMILSAVFTRESDVGLVSM